jgi:hypothetical protein
VELADSKAALIVYRGHTSVEGGAYTGVHSAEYSNQSFPVWKAARLDNSQNVNAKSNAFN